MSDIRRVKYAILMMTEGIYPVYSIGIYPKFQGRSKSTYTTLHGLLKTNKLARAIQKLKYFLKEVATDFV